MVVVFKVYPSQIHDFLWTISADDFRVACQVHISALQAGAIQEAENLFLLAESIFGENENSAPKTGKINHDYPVFTSPEQVLAFRNRKT